MSFSELANNTNNNRNNLIYSLNIGHGITLAQNVAVVAHNAISLPAGVVWAGQTLLDPVWDVLARWAMQYEQGNRVIINQFIRLLTRRQAYNQFSVRVEEQVQEPLAFPGVPPQGIRQILLTGPLDYLIAPTPLGLPPGVANPLPKTWANAHTITNANLQALITWRDVMIIEAKRDLGNLNNPTGEWQLCAQLAVAYMMYAAGLPAGGGVPANVYIPGVLTDGATWIFYQFHVAQQNATLMKSAPYSLGQATVCRVGAAQAIKQGEEAIFGLLAKCLRANQIQIDKLA